MSTAVSAEPANTADWWVQVRGQTYGPYTQAQLIAYIGEGRVRPGTLVTQSPRGEWFEARSIESLMAPFRTPTPANAAHHGHDEAANIFVHAEIFSGAHHAFLAALESLGPLCELAQGLWLVRTHFSAGVIRNTLSQTLERGDRFVVVDATRDRFAWFNLGPEIDVRIKDVWNAPLPASEKARA